MVVLKVSSRKVHADALHPADLAEGGGGPGLPLDHLGEQGKPD